jgi:ATP-dependent DNA helicase RecG
LGSGIPRILEVYDKKCFSFYDNFLRMILPNTPQVTSPISKLLEVLNGEMSRQELQLQLKLKDKKHFKKLYLIPALELKLIEMTIPEKPNSSLQKYRRVG